MEFKKLVEQAEAGVISAEKAVELLQGQVEDRVGLVKAWLVELQSKHASTRYDIDEFEDFLGRPFTIVPKSESEWWVIAPRFLTSFHVGSLHHSEGAYNHFLVNQYSRWFGDVPPELLPEFNFKETLRAVVRSGILEFDSEADAEIGAKRFATHITQRVRGETTKFHVKEGHDFDLIAEMLEDGILPFVPEPVPAELLRPAGEVWWTPEWETLEKRAYQDKAYRTYLETGAVGIFWPTGAGKTVVPLRALGSLKGRKLVVVDTIANQQQWQARLRLYLQPAAAAQVEVVTYQGYDKIRQRMVREGSKFVPYSLLVADECHVLPASTFSRFATIPARSRIGLSATPQREDKKEKYIFALTGFPIGGDWGEFFRLGIVEAPDVTLVITKTLDEKLRRVDDLLAEVDPKLERPKRTIVFSDSLAIGEAVAKHNNLVFVHGKTGGDRIKVIDHELRHRGAVVVSRVGDTAVSMPHLERVIEVDFLEGSRRQEGQRMGRVMHGEGKGEHVVLMTRDEFDDHQKRLFAIREKGIRIRVLQG